MTLGVLLTIAFVLFLWWFSTGALFLLVRRPESNTRRSMVVTSIVSACALVGLIMTLDVATVGGAVVAFACAIVIWAWHELSFLTGSVTGPRKTRLPEGTTGWMRFKFAFAAIRDHELALFATVLVLAALSYGVANPIGLLTFGLLWVMRLSAKFNLFVGVRFVAADIMPPKLKHLASYFRVAAPGPFFVVSVGAASLVLAGLVNFAFVAETDFAVIAATALATLLALAIAEHLFMILPVHETPVWSWLFPQSERDSIDRGANTTDLRKLKDMPSGPPAGSNNKNTMRPPVPLSRRETTPPSAPYPAKPVQIQG